MQTKPNYTILFSTCAWLALALSVQAQALGPVQDQPDGPWYMPGEVLIKFKSNATDKQLQDAVGAAGVKSVKHIQTRAMKAKGEHGITRAETTQPLAQAIQALAKHPAVEYAQTNWVYWRQDSNDPYYQNGSLWGMYGASTTPYANPYGSGAGQAWAEGSFGSGDVCVGIVDQGVQFDHIDLAANMWRNPNEIEGDAIDNDGNGVVDDLFGINAITDDGNIVPEPHGTHVAGTIGALGGNGLGVVGVNWAVSLISGRFLGSDGYGTTIDAIQAIDYMTVLKTSKGINLVALNNSWSGGAYDPALFQAIVRAAQADILFVAAAGNGNFAGRAINTDSSPVYPACYNTTSAAGYDAVIAVTAIAPDGSKPRWANYGVNTIDLGAPGVGIWSTLPGDSYAAYDGTSMATPHVTGAIALYAAKYPGVTAADIKTALLASITATSSLASRTVTGGRLDIVKFLAQEPPNWSNPTAPPAAPSGLAATALSSSQISLSWTDNSDNESRFEITRSSAGLADFTITVGANVTTFIDSGLQATTTYSYTIKACNSKGCTDGTAIASATTLAPPTPATAIFVKEDTTTKGNWRDNYGSEGYHIIQYNKNPSYGTATSSGLIHKWADSTSDLRGLQTPDGSSRFAWCYYSHSTINNHSFTLDVNLTDSQPHRVALYCVDWDTFARAQRIDVIDAYYGNIIESRNLSGFNGGVYLVFNIQGHVLIKITNTGDVASNAVLSGIFLDVAADCSPTVSISSPANGATLSGTVEVTAAASDDWGVNQVQFFADGNLIGTDTDGTDGWLVSWNTTSFGDGSHTITAQAIDTANQTTTSAEVSVTVNNSVPATMHCGDLDGIKAKIGKNWKATVTVTIHNTSHAIVSGATVAGTWSGGYTGTVTLTTGVDGKVSFTTGSIPGTISSVTFSINNVTHSNLTYDSVANHDPDGDSNGTSITVPKP